MLLALLQQRQRLCRAEIHHVEATLWMLLRQLTDQLHRGDFHGGGTRAQVTRVGFRRGFAGYAGFHQLHWFLKRQLRMELLGETID